MLGVALLLWLQKWCRCKRTCLALGLRTHIPRVLSGAQEDFDDLVVSRISSILSLPADRPETLRTSYASSLHTEETCSSAGNISAVGRIVQTQWAVFVCLEVQCIMLPNCPGGQGWQHLFFFCILPATVRSVRGPTLARRSTLAYQTVRSTINSVTMNVRLLWFMISTAVARAQNREYR